MSILCNNEKCFNNDGDGWCTEDSIRLSISSADYDHLSQYMMECLSFFEKAKDEEN